MKNRILYEHLSLALKGLSSTTVPGLEIIETRFMLSDAGQETVNEWRFWLEKVESHAAGQSLSQ